jgi:hypothetical protein
MVADHPAPPRLFYVEYKSAINGRVARLFVKIPYGVWQDGLYALTENLDRALLTGQITRYTVEVAKPGAITPEVRGRLTRWREALATSTKRTRVEWA